MTVARTVFCLSLVATLFWAFGFAVAYLAGTEPALLSYAVPAIAVAWISVFAIFRAWPRFLTVDPGTTGRFLRAAVAWTVVAYVGGALLVGALAYWFLKPDAHSSEILRSEASLAAYISALWLPLWFAPAAGLCLGWWHLAGGVRSNSTIERDARKNGVRPSS